MFTIRYDAPLILVGVPERAFLWRAYQPYQLAWEPGRTTPKNVQAGSVQIPRGYMTDLASVPRLIWWLIAPWDNRIAAAAVVHDYLYETHDRRRHEADAILYYGMGPLGAHWLQQWLVWLSVRCGGRRAYRTGPARGVHRRAETHLREYLLPVEAQVAVSIAGLVQMGGGRG